MAPLSRTEWMRANRGTTVGGGFVYEGPDREAEWDAKYDAYVKKFNETKGGTVPSSADKSSKSGSGGSGSGSSTDVLEGLPSREYEPAAGGIPQVTPPEKTQADAILSNLKNLPQLLELSRLVDESNLERLRAQYEKSFPNYAQTERQISQNIAAGARGELSQGVLNNLQQTAAERGMALGMPSVRGGNTLANTTLLRMLGNTTEQLQANALNQLGQYNATSPRVSLYNPASMFTSPQEQAQSQWLANLLNSAPVPWQNQQAALDAVKAGMGTGFNAGRANQGYPYPSMPSMPSSLMDIFKRYAPTANIQQPQQQPQQPGTYDISSRNVVGPNWTPQNISPYSPADYGFWDLNKWSQPQTPTENPPYMPQRNFVIEDNTVIPGGSWWDEPYNPVDAYTPTEYPTDLYNPTGAVIDWWNFGPEGQPNYDANSYNWNTPFVNSGPVAPANDDLLLGNGDYELGKALGYYGNP